MSKAMEMVGRGVAGQDQDLWKKEARIRWIDQRPSVVCPSQM